MTRTRSATLAALLASLLMLAACDPSKETKVGAYMTPAPVAQVRLALAIAVQTQSLRTSSQRRSCGVRT